MADKPMMMVKPSAKAKSAMKSNEVPAEIAEKMQQMKVDKADKSGNKAREESMGSIFKKGGKVKKYARGGGIEIRGKTRGKMC